MSCMEHYCRNCKQLTFDNTHYLTQCDRCKSNDIESTWDEINDDFEAIIDDSEDSENNG